MRAVLVLLVACLLAHPACAEGDFALILRSLRDQVSHRTLITEKASAVEMEAETLLRKEALPSALADERLAQLDLAPALSPVKEALGEDLAEIDPLLAADAFTTSDADPHRFIKTLSYLNLSKPVVWKAPEVRKAADRAFETLTKLDRDGLTLSYSGRYHGTHWTYDSCCSWNPLRRRATLYIVGSSPMPGGRSKSFTFTVTGSVIPRAGTAAATPSRNHSFTINLEDAQFHASSSEIELVGHWNHRFEPGKGVQVTTTNQVNLKVSNMEVQGKLTQDLLVTDSKGKVLSGRITYNLMGRVGPQGELEGTFEGPADPKVTGWLDDPAPDKVRGTFAGKLDRSGAQGTLTLRGSDSYTIPWEAREQR